MRRLLEAFRTRVVPAILTAIGIMLVTAGLLSYADPTTAGEIPSGPPVIVTPEPSATPGATGAPSASVEPSPSGSGSPEPSASAGPRATATRVVIPAMRIDLPVIRGPAGYPPCNVAMYLKELGQPGQARATYLYAHARTGMFLPMLDQSKVNNGRKMLGMLVQVFTSDDKLYLYEITEVRRHARTLDDAFAATVDELWLQTSEGPNSSYPKLQVVATFLSVSPADPGEAHPKAKPVAC